LAPLRFSALFPKRTLSAGADSEIAMKTLALASLALCALMGTSIAQLSSSPTLDTPKRENGVVFDRFTLSSAGLVMVTRDGKTQRVVQEFVLTNGTHLLPNGDIIFSTGKRTHLQHNQLLTLDGVVQDTAVTKGGAAPVYPAGATDDRVVGISSHDGISVSGADTLITRNGVSEKVIKEFELSGGTVVKPNGSIVDKDGKSLILRENQVLGFDGVLRETRVRETIPSGDSLASPENPKR
jgi:hypothetical protein